MDPIHPIINRCFGARGNELLVGGIPITSLAEQYGTPFFVYDRSALDQKLNALRETLPSEFDIYYSVKANPNLTILRHFVSRGCGLEIASAGEFLQARAAGCPGERILFAGPGKMDDELELALKNNIGEIHIESPREAERIAAICKTLGVRARVSVRVNPTGDAQGGAMRMGGKPAPFGIDEENVDSLVQYLASASCFDFRGIHMFSGTQILDHAVLLTQYRKCIAIARHVASCAGMPLHTVDFGGGLGIPYFANERELDLSRLREGLITLMADVRDDPVFRDTRFVVEPGRFLVGEAGIYVARINDIKESRGKKFLILDGGMNHHLAASGNLGQTIKRNYPIALVQRLNCPLEEKVDVVGPLCTPLDTLGRDVNLPKAEVGDLIGVFQSGAYARSASPLGFLSHKTPAEVWVDDKEDFLIRSRGSAEDFMRDICLPPVKTGHS
jgi:diaminopimelate decarboxylase